MTLLTTIEQAFEAFQRESERTNVILIHPRSRYRSLLIARLLNETSLTTFYYAMRPDDISLSAFIGGLIQELSRQQPTFGRILNMMDPDIFKNYKQNKDEIITNFIQELEELSNDPFVFILDEYDRSDDTDELHRFIQALVSKLPARCRLVLNSRTLPRLPWIAMIARNQAILLRDDRLIEEDFHETHKDSPYNMEVFALGNSSVIYEGEGTGSWEGHLPRLLFFFALDRPIVTRAEICHAFWPELGNDQAVNVFHVTKRRLHKALGMDVLVHDTSFYQVSPQFNIYYDVMEFVACLMKGRNPARSSEERLEFWKKAETLYQGPFLQGHTDAWILDRRQAFRTGFIEALVNIGILAMEGQDNELALHYFNRALDEEYRQDTVHQRLMQLYAQLDRRPDVVKHYQRLEQYAQEQNYIISPETVQIYNDIMP